MKSQESARRNWHGRLVEVKPDVPGRQPECDKDNELPARSPKRDKLNRWRPTTIYFCAAGTSWKRASASGCQPDDRWDNTDRATESMDASVRSAKEMSEVYTWRLQHRCVHKQETQTGGVRAWRRSALSRRRKCSTAPKKHTNFLKNPPLTGCTSRSNFFTTVINYFEITTVRKFQGDHIPSVRHEVNYALYSGVGKHTLHVYGCKPSVSYSHLLGVVIWQHPSALQPHPHFPMVHSLWANSWFCPFITTTLTTFVYASWLSGPMQDFVHPSQPSHSLLFMHHDPCHQFCEVSASGTGFPVLASTPRGIQLHAFAWRNNGSDPRLGLCIARILQSWHFGATRARRFAILLGSLKTHEWSHAHWLGATAEALPSLNLGG